MGNWMKGSQIEERHNDIRTSIVCGNQWGDTGKGKITDILAQYSDVIVRFQGGHNAGHTVIVGEKEFDLHILPSGMVSEGKINIITSGCVLGINLGKVDLSKIELTKAGLICKSNLDDFLRRDKDGEKIQVGLVPELQKLTQGGVDIKKSGLRISGETTVIGMHNVILDAYDEICRKAAGLELIGSTGSGISRAYASEMQRYHFTLNDLLYHPDNFYNSIEALWDSYKHVFPKISVDELIRSAKKERADIIEYIKRGEIKIIGNETQYIKDLHKKGKRIVGEGAQGAMIGSGNSFFGTASQPGLQAFCDTTGLTASKIGNIFLVNKFPGSSVGTRPGYLKYPDSPELNWFRNKYKEFGVSTGRPRDLFRYSLPEIARGAWLNVRGIDTEDKIVPVYNRVDGVEDALKIDKGLMKVVTGFQYDFDNIVDEITENIRVGVHSNEALEPRTLLRNYPEKSAQANLFHLDQSNLRMIEIKGNIEQQVEQLLGVHNAAIFKKSSEREFLIGTGPDRNDLELRKGTPMRRLVNA